MREEGGRRSGWIFSIESTRVNVDMDLIVCKLELLTYISLSILASISAALENHKSQ